MKIVAFKGQYRITLPKDLVKDKGWDPGTELRFVEDEQGRIYLKPITAAPSTPSSASVRRKGGGRA